MELIPSWDPVCKRANYTTILARVQIDCLDKSKPEALEFCPAGTKLESWTGLDKPLQQNTKEFLLVRDCYNSGLTGRKEVFVYPSCGKRSFELRFFMMLSSQINELPSVEIPIRAHATSTLQNSILSLSSRAGNAIDLKLFV